jgi:uncharacterized membrane protein
MVTVFKHPLHIMLIHFPSALLPMDVVCYAIYYFTADTSFAFASFYALAGAVLTGWLSIVFGTLDLISITPDKGEVMKQALLHGGINITIIIIYTVITYSVYKGFPQMPAASMTILVIKAFLVTCMVIGNYIGGSLILKHKIGIED